MTTRFHCAAALAALFAATLAPRQGVAQAAAMFSACYVPGVGAIYMIKQQGLPSACLSNAHAEISWKDGGGELPDGAVLTVKLANGAVTTAKIEDLAITVEKLAVGAVTGAKLADGAVSSDKIADGAVSGVKLADDAVSAAKIADGAIGSAHIGDGQVTQAKLGADVVLLPGPGSVNAAMIATGAVETSKLASQAVTLDKFTILGPWSVLGRAAATQGQAHVMTASVDGQVLRRSAGSLGFGQIDDDGIANGAVTTAKLAPAARAGVATRTFGGFSVSSVAPVDGGFLALNAPGAGSFLLFLTGYALVTGDDSSVDVSLGTVSLGTSLGTIRAGVTEGTGTVSRRFPFALSSVLVASSSGPRNVYLTLSQPATDAAAAVSVFNLRLTAIFIPQ